MLYLRQKAGKIKPRSKLLPVLIFVLIAFAGCLNQAMAQSRNNQSDWNVPPPLPPGSTHKGSAPKGAPAKPIVLTISDIPGVSQPVTPPVQVTVLAALGTTPPDVNAPEQPADPEVNSGLPAIPLPQAPDAPPLPKQTLQDEPAPANFDMPLPVAPELPALPTEPTPTAVPPSTIKGSLPVMPDVIIEPPLSLPANTDITPWGTPVIPDEVKFKMVMPAETKAAKAHGKGTKKLKP